MQDREPNISLQDYKDLNPDYIDIDPPVARDPEKDHDDEPFFVRTFDSVVIRKQQMTSQIPASSISDTSGKPKSPKSPKLKFADQKGLALERVRPLFDPENTPAVQNRKTTHVTTRYLSKIFYNSNH